jgi:hypothetical protein
MTNLTAIITAHSPQCLAGGYSLLVRQIPMRRLGLALLVLFVMSAASVAMAQEPPTLDGSDGRDLVLRLFRPEPAVKTPVTTIQRARFPVVDIHTHFRVRTRQSPEARDAYVELMDRNGIAISVSMDGGWGDEFQEHAKHLWEKHRERFVIFANVNWRGSGKESEPATWDCQRPEFGRVAAEKLAEARRQGASGLKLFKDFGLSYRNPDGSFIKVDDPRFDPIWEACGKLGMPVLMHTADPSAFFAPIDAKNERWEELHRRPRVELSREGLSLARGTAGGSQSSGREAPQDDLHRRPYGQRRGRPRHTRAVVGTVSKPLCGNRFANQRARPATLLDSSLPDPLLRPSALWHRRSLARDSRATVLALPRNFRRELSLFRKGISTSRVLEHSRRQLTRRRPQKALPRKRRPPDPRRERKDEGRMKDEG